MRSLVTWIRGLCRKKFVRLRRTDEFLATQVSKDGDLYYEVSMLVATPAQLAKLPQSRADRSLDEDVLWKALVESFVVHARVLIEVMAPTDATLRNPDNVIAAEFFDSPTQWKDTWALEGARRYPGAVPKLVETCRS